ncbi:MAG: hypothetical protein R8K21_08705 [Mariprofundales bacterium]
MAMHVTIGTGKSPSAKESHDLNHLGLVAGMYANQKSYCTMGISIL